MDTSIDPPSETRTDVGAESNRPRFGTNGRLFSLKWLIVSVLAVGSGSVVGGSIPLIGGTIGRVIGIATAAFLVGLVASDRRYIEAGIAGASVGTISAVLGLVSVGVLPIGVRFLGEYGLSVAVLGAATGLVVTGIGYYFGRDLKAGLTRDVGA